MAAGKWPTASEREPSMMMKIMQGGGTQELTVGRFATRIKV